MQVPQKARMPKTQNDILLMDVIHNKEVLK